MLWHALIDFILPPRCVMSGAIVERQGALSPAAWSSLSFIAEPYCPHCGVPFEFDTGGDSTDMRCVDCLDNPPTFDSARSALRYDDESRELILRFKHGDKTEAVPVFVPWLKQAGAEMIAQADLIVPVPLHPHRLLKRRYNQAGLIAQALGRDTNIAVIPALLERRRATPPQGHMKSEDRHKNVRQAFTVNERHAAALKDKIVILIDDVYTTGATVQECSAALRQGGARAVHVLTLARVVKT